MDSNRRGKNIVLRYCYIVDKIINFVNLLILTLHTQYIVCKGYKPNCTNLNKNVNFCLYI